MSVDLLQDKIRKLKNPSVIDFSATKDHIPPHILEQSENLVDAYGLFCRQLLDGLKGVVPAVRFSMGWFSLLGGAGITLLQSQLAYARKQSYYVLLDGIQTFSNLTAQHTARMLLDEQWQFDGLITSAYIGSDGLKPFAEKMMDSRKGLYAVIRTGNKTAPELQDLMTGSRLVHSAAADIANRLGETMPGRCGYNGIGAMAGASSADGLRALRSKYQRLFLLLDGFDYPNANAKNCSYAFDKLGHGAAACAGLSVIAAWQEAQSDGKDYVEKAAEAAERMKKNLTRYVTIL